MSGAGTARRRATHTEGFVVLIPIYAVWHRDVSLLEIAYQIIIIAPLIYMAGIRSLRIT